MGAIGAVFQPELIELMKAVLDDAAAMLPEAKRTSTMKAEIASHILACAAKGERNPTALEIRRLRPSFPVHRQRRLVSCHQLRDQYSLDGVRRRDLHRTVRDS